MNEPKQCCPCCGNRYEQGGGCDCDRNIQRITALEDELQIFRRWHGLLARLASAPLTEKQEILLAEIKAHAETKRELAEERARADTAVAELQRRQNDTLALKRLQSIHSEQAKRIRGLLDELDAARAK